MQNKKVTNSAKGSYRLTFLQSLSLNLQISVARNICQLLHIF